jgi:hypothetical protein
MEFFDQENNIAVVLHPIYFSLFPRLKIKLKGRHFDTTERLEAEPRAVLNSLTEHDFQYALGTVRTHGRGLLLGDGGQ